MGVESSAQVGFRDSNRAHPCRTHIQGQWVLPDKQVCSPPGFPGELGSPKAQGSVLNLETVVLLNLNFLTK